MRSTWHSGRVRRGRATIRSRARADPVPLLGPVGAHRRTGAAHARQPRRPRPDADIADRSRSSAGCGRNAAHHELIVLLAEDKSGRLADRQGEEELRAIDAEGKENERLAAALQGLLTDLQNRTDRLIKDHCARIVEALREVVQALLGGGMRRTCARPLPTGTAGAPGGAMRRCCGSGWRSASSAHIAWRSRRSASWNRTSSRS